LGREDAGYGCIEAGSQGYDGKGEMVAHSYLNLLWGVSSLEKNERTVASDDKTWAPQDELGVSP
jgi:hypothetical protein